MKFKLDVHNNRVRVFESGDGIRRRFYDAVEPDRFLHPKNIRLNHALSWYCDGHISRPLLGVYSCGKLAEHLLALYRRKDNSTGERYISVVGYYASTRRAMEQILKHLGIDSRLSGRTLGYVRHMYDRLCLEGRALLVVLPEYDVKMAEKHSITPRNGEAPLTPTAGL